jgi:hypothetical protein
MFNKASSASLQAIGLMLMVMMKRMMTMMMMKRMMTMMMMKRRRTTMMMMMMTMEMMFVEPWSCTPRWPSQSPPKTRASDGRQFPNKVEVGPTSNCRKHP